MEAVIKLDEKATVSKNEILTALNKPKNSSSRLVKVDGDTTSTTNLKTPFVSSPDFGAVSVTYKIGDLMRRGMILLEK